MDTVKRIFSGIVIVISVLGLILCLSGIIGAWAINTPLTDKLTGTFAQAEIVLDFSNTRLDQTESSLSDAQALLSTLKEALTGVSENLSENSPTLTFLSNTVGTELKPKIETAAEVITTLRGTIISLNSTLEAANQIPFVSVPTLPMEQLTAVDQQMQEMVDTVKSLGDAIRDIENGVITRTSAMVIVPVDRLSEIVIQIHTPVKNLNTTLAQVKTSVAQAKERIPALIDWGSILITLILVWFALAQASLLYGGWYYWKTGTLPTI